MRRSASLEDPTEWRRRMEDVFLVEPNDLVFAPLTAVYKQVTGRLKVWPFLYILPLSFVGASLLYVLFGPAVVALASVLQYGF